MPSYKFCYEQWIVNVMQIWLSLAIMFIQGSNNFDTSSDLKIILKSVKTTIPM